MKILLIGANGQVGQEILAQAAKDTHNIQIIAYDRNQLDLATYDGDAAILKKAFGQAPHAIINAAAYTHVDKAETEPELAAHINHYAVAALQAAATQINSLLLHYSTDYVFSGQSQTSYCETDEPAPLNIYGKTKLDGDTALQQAQSPCFILRTAWIHSPYGHNFIKTILKAAQEQKNLKIVNDQWGTPTSAELIAHISLKLLKMKLVQKRPIAYGLYHLTAQGVTDRHAYAQFIVRTAYPEQTPNITPITSADYDSLAPRPRHTQLNCNKIQNALNESLPHWQVGAKKTIMKLLKEPL